jgi:hypothetical protein
MCRPSSFFCLVMRLIGAGDETRTRDSLLGRQVLYQLSYPRACLAKFTMFQMAVLRPQVGRRWQLAPGA